MVVALEARLFPGSALLLSHRRGRSGLGSAGPFVILGGSHVERDFAATDDFLMRKVGAPKWPPVETFAVDIAMLCPLFVAEMTNFLPAEPMLRVCERRMSI